MILAPFASLLGLDRTSCRTRASPWNASKFAVICESAQPLRAADGTGRSPFALLLCSDKNISARGVRLRDSAPSEQPAQSLRCARRMKDVDIGGQLTKDHAEIDKLLECLAEDAEAPECGPLQSTWSRLERRLLQHLNTEQRHLLPFLEARDPTATIETRREHARMRELVSALGVAIDLHAARKATISELRELFHSHAEREERTYEHIQGGIPSHHQISAHEAAALVFAMAEATKARHDD